VAEIKNQAKKEDSFKQENLNKTNESHVRVGGASGTDTCITGFRVTRHYIVRIAVININMSYRIQKDSAGRYNITIPKNLWTDSDGRKEVN
jgi:hypothetical protein